MVISIKFQNDLIDNCEGSSLNAEWKNDCQGKKDYDADVIRISCRAYPQWGGFSAFHPATGTWEENQHRPDIPPDAYVNVCFQDKTLFSAQITADTEDELRQAVEAWAEEQFKRITAAVSAIYQPEIQALKKGVTWR